MRFEKWYKEKYRYSISGEKQMKIEGIEISLVKQCEVGDVLDFQQEGKVIEKMIGYGK